MKPLKTKGFRVALRYIKDEILTLEDTVGKFLIEQSAPLHGEVEISGAKNAVLPIMAATILAKDDYEINDFFCYKIRRLEEELYKNFLPSSFNIKNIVTYQWQQSRKVNQKGHFNFYLSISHNSISSGSVLIYILIIILLNAVGSMTWDLIKTVYALITQ